MGGGRARSSSRLGALALVGMLVTACASGSGNTVEGYNHDRTVFTKVANARARDVVDQIVAARVDCRSYSDSVLAPLRATYVRQRVPIPLGQGQCEGGAARENVLVEVFPPKAPNAATFMARKAELLCKQGFELGRKPDGTNDFPGLPYVMAVDQSWVVEPDSKAFNVELARALHRPARDACAARNDPSR